MVYGGGQLKKIALISDGWRRMITYAWVDGIIRRIRELDEAIAEMLNHNGAFVLVANVETCGMVYPMVPAGGSVTNMILGDK